MTRGKEALQAANRRIAEANAAADRLREELANDRASSQSRIRELEGEVRHLRADHLAEASRLAADEVTRRLAEVEEQRRRRGLSDDIAMNLVYQKDSFVGNACRYVSMTTGKPPAMAMAIVFTWMTNRDFYGAMDQEKFLLEHGLPLDGWVARTWNRFGKHYERIVTRNAIRRGRPDAISLDRAEAEGHSAIHPRYDPKWYGEIKDPERAA